MGYLSPDHPTGRYCGNQMCCWGRAGKKEVQRMRRVKTVDHKAKLPMHKRRPKTQRSGRKRRNPAAGLDLSYLQSFVGDTMVAAALHGATLTEKTIVAAIMPGLLAIVRGGGKFSPDDHWRAFQPHCPQICGVPCPPDCKHHGEARFDGCHVCDCLHGEQNAVKT